MTGFQKGKNSHKNSEENIETSHHVSLSHTPPNSTSTSSTISTFIIISESTQKVPALQSTDNFNHELHSHEINSESSTKKFATSEEVDEKSSSTLDENLQKHHEYLPDSRSTSSGSREKSHHLKINEPHEFFSTKGIMEPSSTSSIESLTTAESTHQEILKIHGDELQSKIEHMENRNSENIEHEERKENRDLIVNSIENDVDTTTSIFHHHEFSVNKDDMTTIFHEIDEFSKYSGESDHFINPLRTSIEEDEEHESTSNIDSLEKITSEKTHDADSIWNLDESSVEESDSADESDVFTFNKDSKEILKPHRTTKRTTTISINITTSSIFPINHQQTSPSSDVTVQSKVKQINSLDDTEVNKTQSTVIGNEMSSQMHVTKKSRDGIDNPNDPLHNVENDDKHRKNVNNLSTVEFTSKHHKHSQNASDVAFTFTTPISMNNETINDSLSTSSSNSTRRKKIRKIKKSRVITTTTPMNIVN